MTVIVDRDVPQNFVGKRIVFISDIHYGQYFERERVEGLIKIVSELNPDIVVLGGGYVSSDMGLLNPVLKNFQNSMQKWEFLELREITTNEQIIISR